MTISYLKKRWDHQAEGEERAIKVWLADADRARREDRLIRSGYALLFDPGTGKTGAAINVIRRLGKLWKKFPRILIFAPPVVLDNWLKEFGIFSQIPKSKIHVLADEGHRRLKKFKAHAFDVDGKPQPGIFIINYEGIVGRPGSALDELYYAILRWAPEILIPDEGHYLKDGTTRRTKQIDIIANPQDPKTKRWVPGPFVLHLTGTPVANKLLDVFSQWLIIDGGQTFGRNFYEFRARYFYDKKANMRGQRRFSEWVLKPGSEEKIRGLMARRSMSALKSECLSLPPLLRQVLEFDMGDVQARHYHEMRKQLITYIDSDACVAKLAITKALRLMQIASGFIRTEDGVDHPFDDNPKRQALKELLYSTAPDHKTIVWAVFKQNYLTIADVCKELDLPFQFLVGGMTKKQRDLSIARFNQEGKYRVLIGNPGSGGIGCNLTASSYAFSYSSNFSSLHRGQAMARNHRGGSEIHESITWCDLVMNGTIEKEILKSLDAKEEVSLNLLQALSSGKKSLGGLYGK